MSRSKIFRLYGDEPISGEGLQNLGLWPQSKLAETFMLPHLLWHGNSVFAVSCKEPPHFVILYDKQGILSAYSNSTPCGRPMQLVFTWSKGYTEDLFYRGSKHVHITVRCKIQGYHAWVDIKCFYIDEFQLEHI